VYVTPIALTAELLHVINATDGCITHTRTYHTRVSLPEEDIIVLHLLSLSLRA